MSNSAAASMRAVECVVSFFLIGWLGYWLTKRRWFSDESAALLTRLLTGVIIPINLLYNINVSTTRESFLPLLPYLFVPSMSILLTMLLAYCFAGRIRMERAHRNIFIVASACSNTINIGLPINLALFGTEALPGVLLYYMGNTIVFWTLGDYLLALDAEGTAKAPVLSVATAKRILSPPICAFLAGLLLLALNIRIPPIVGIAGNQLSGMTTPLSILCIGIAIYRTGLRNIRLTRDVGLIAIGRFVASPLILLGFLYLIPVPEMMRNVFLIQSSLPPMSNIALLSIKYRTDSGFAAVSVSFGTLCALATVPAYMALLAGFSG